MKGTLNEKQQEAVVYTEGPLLILAGAGSGKTRVITHRIAYLIEEKGVNPWHILAITFTNKAAGEMRRRVDELVDFGGDSIWVSTFHSMCVRILRRHIDVLGYDNHFTIYDTDDQKTLMKEICKLLQINTKIYKERALLSAISQGKNEMLTPEDLIREAQGDYGILQVAKVYKEYEKQMKANNALDFDDLLLKTVALFDGFPEILKSYQERFRYIMVDEYQDTNSVQFELIRQLSAGHRNLCVVGDDDQSIYKFRGANIKNILNFEKVFQEAKVVKLEQNYRSTNRILEAANAVIRHNSQRKDKSLWTENEAGNNIRIREFETAFQEGEFVAQDIASRVRGGLCGYSDHAILYRTNAQSRMFEEKFITANIPYKIIGGLQFYARKEIKDILAYLKTVDNGHDDLAVRRIINVPKRGIGLSSINKLQDYALEKDIDFYEAVLSVRGVSGMERAAAKVESFAALIEELKRELEGMSLTDFIQHILDRTGYIESLDGEDEAQIAARIENIEELLSKVALYEEECEDADEVPTLRGFLEEVALVADVDTLEEGSDYVVLMTIHSAKGLEFPTVYLVGMEDGLFPSYLTITSMDSTEIEEERRLCYVGITRAEQELVMTWAHKRMVRGEVRYNKMSRFLRELPPSLYSPREKSFGKPQEPASSRGQEMFRRKVFEEIKTGQELLKQGKKPDYDIGDRVLSKKYGEGIVRDLVDGGRDFEVTVEFSGGNTRKMFAAFGKLIKL